MSSILNSDGHCSIRRSKSSSQGHRPVRRRSSSRPRPSSILITTGDVPYRIYTKKPPLSKVTKAVPLVATPVHSKGKRLRLLPGFCCLQAPVTPAKSSPATNSNFNRKEPPSKPIAIVVKTTPILKTVPSQLSHQPSKEPPVTSSSKMPNIKGRVNDFLQRQLSFVNSSSPSTEDDRQPHSLGVLQPRVKPRRSLSHRETTINKASPTKSKGPSANEKRSFINRYLDGNQRQPQPDIICGKTCYDLPVKEINQLSRRILNAYTGPGKGLTCVNLKQKVTAFEPPLDADVDFIDEDLEESLEYLSLSHTVTSASKQNGAKLSVGKEDSVNTDKRQVHSSSSSDDSEESNYRPSSGDSFHSAATLPLEHRIAGVDNWFSPSEIAYGISTTLYESHPISKINAGDPIADSFGICVRENSAILALADGVNWGVKASLAAKCAIHGCIDYLNTALYHEGSKVENTMDIFVSLLRSFQAAHDLILQEDGLLTTLTVAVVSQLKNSDRFIVCTCNVGDSLAYVYSRSHGVREITQGSHDIFSNRDMRDALGALGPVDGQHPELSNLTVAMTIVDQGDIVFLTSDGVSDNFDPVVGKFALPRKKSIAGDVASENHQPVKSGKKVEQTAAQIPSKCSPRTERAKKVAASVRRSTSNPDKHAANKVLRNQANGLPIVSAEQRHELTSLRMEDVLRNGLGDGQLDCSSASRLCDLMIEFATKLTTAKRRILEDTDLYNEEDEFDSINQRQRRRKVADKLAMVPGKLDHASVVAYKVGFRGSLSGQNFYETAQDKKKHNLRLKATLARFESNEDFSTFHESAAI
ncbi:PP2C-like domain-containing protein [Halotydeus destructor]|nr:PP2C-like domain-containing protein [Halotydeus destructor]